MCNLAEKPKPLRQLLPVAIRLKVPVRIKGEAQEGLFAQRIAAQVETD